MCGAEENYELREGREEGKACGDNSFEISFKSKIRPGRACGKKGYEVRR